MSIKFSVFIFGIVLACPLLCFASPAEIVGYWFLEKSVGEPCASQILDLEYGFNKDGSYEIKSKMNLGVTKKEMEAKGTYKISGNMVTGYVDGSTVGPFKYKVENDRLTIYQGSPACEVHLIREE